MLSRLIPHRIRQTARQVHRRFVFKRAIKFFAADPVRAVEDSARLADLIYGWGNEGWSAEHEYLRHVIQAVASLDDKNVLECGSGLSTLLMAATVAKHGGHVTSLEHHPEWAIRIRKALASCGLATRASVIVSPLRSYGSYSWYEAPPDSGEFDCVLCDGPPAATEGGRYGLVPVMRHRLRPGCRILLDDAARPEERRILAEWAKETGASYQVIGIKKPFAELVLPKL